MKTKARILETACELFNRDGVNDTSTNHIATALGISPGNLYYHYRNKEEIIRALFEVFDAASEALFQLPGERAPRLDDLERLITGNFQLQWQYRFLYRDLMGLLRRDPELMASYRRQRQRGFEGTRELIQLFAANGVIAPVTDADALDEITRLVWMCNDFWLPSLELGGEPVTPERFQQGAALLERILRPQS